MEAQRFQNEVREFWDACIKFVHDSMAPDRKRRAAFFPTCIIFYETPNHFCFELVGASQSPRRLRQKKRLYNSPQDIFDVTQKNQYSPMFRFNGDNNRVSGICFAAEDVHNCLASRFPIFEDYQVKFIGKDGAGPHFYFGESANRFYMSDCLFVYAAEQSQRIRHVNAFGLVSKTIRTGDLRQYLKSAVYEESGGFIKVHGLPAYDSGSERNAVAAQLQSLFLNQKVHETEIGWFLSDHKEIVCSALGVEELLPEVKLEHQCEIVGEDRQSIKPDLLIRRPDGFYDILDLKLAKLDKRSITKGPRSRRRFIDYVDEGLAQLAHYEEYFTFPENAEYALREFGIRTYNPRLLLVVGHEENAKSKDVQEACRKYGDKRISIIDYDTLLRMFLSG